MRSIATTFALLGALAASTAAFAAEESATVPVNPITITKPPTGKVDNLFATAPIAEGFLVTWARSTSSIPPFTLIAQKYTPAGKVTGKAVVFDTGTVGDVTRILPLGGGKVALFWLGGGKVKAAKLDLATMTVSAKTDLGKSDDHIHDVALLPNGNIAVVTARVDISNPSDVRYKNSIKVVSQAFATVRDWASVHGTGFKIDGWAYYDQTVVSTGTGGIALYRDHATNKLVGRNFSNTGVQASSLITLNTTLMSAPSVIDFAYFRIRAVKLTSGKVAACWVSLEETGSKRYEVRCRILSDTGQPLAKDFRVNALPDGGQTSPDVVALPGDKFLVTWVHADSIFPASVKHRAYDSTGKALYAERIGHAFTVADLTGAPLDTEAARLGDGSVAVVMDQTAFVTGLRAYGIAAP